MKVLNRATLLAQLDRASSGEVAVEELVNWAFKTWGDEAEGLLVYEASYGRVIGQVVDDLMFGDDPHFRPTSDQLAQMRQLLMAAVPEADVDDQAGDEDDDDE